MALSLRQPLQLAQHGPHLPGLVQRLIRRKISRNQTLRKPLIKLFRPYAPSAIKGKIPRNANQPHPHITDRRQRSAMFNHTNKDVLNSVLSLCPAAQDRVGYTE